MSQKLLEKTWTNQANLIPKQWKMRAKRRRNRTKPSQEVPTAILWSKRSDFGGSWGHLGSPWALFCSTLGRLGRFVAPLGVALDPISRFWWLLDGLGSSTNAFLDHFWAILHQKTLKKQGPNKFYSEFEKPWFVRHFCSKNVILEEVRASKIKKNTLKIHEKTRFKQVM